MEVSEQIQAKFSCINMAHLFLKFGFLLLAALACAIGRAEENRAVSYALVRDRVVKAYPQQAEEMSNALSVLQQLSEQTAAVLAQIEAKCSQ